MSFKQVFFKCNTYLIFFLIGYIILSPLIPVAYPQKHQIKSASTLEPKQVETDQESFDYRHKDRDYFVDPLYNYELSGMIVSDNDEYSFWDKIFPILGARIKDICIVWGDNLENLDAISNIHFWNENYTCYYQTRDREAYGKFRSDQLSNNHLIAHDKQVINTILKAGIGDQVKLKGWLSNYGDADTKQIIRTTSTIRTDKGNGACETIFVDAFEITRQNPTLYGFLERNSSKLLLFLIIVRIVLPKYWKTKKRSKPLQL